MAFRSGAMAVVTGQQVGLFGGPAFSLYKALSAVKLASEARKLGVDCVPIFWLATEDHDLEEVNIARVPGPDAQLVNFASSARAAADAPVGGIEFGPEISTLLSQVDSLLGESEATKLLKECYCPGQAFGTSFARLFSHLFAEYGVIVLDGSDPELDQIAAPLYRETIVRSAELNQRLLQRDRELQAATYHEQVHITSSTTPLFVIKNGSRIPLHTSGPGKFSIGSEQIAGDELLQMADSSPQMFSPNVLLRPVMQDYLLPTLAYVGGAAEVAYFAQVGAVYEALLGRVTPILPRFSATLAEPKPQALLERYRLSFSDLFHGPESLQEKLGGLLLDSNLQNSFQQAKAAVEKSMAPLRHGLAKLDQTLIESAENAESKMLYQIANLQSRAARAELRQSEIAGRHARVLSSTLYPEKTLQEREFAGIYFLARYGRELLGGLLSVINPECVDHQVVEL